MGDKLPSDPYGSICESSEPRLATAPSSDSDVRRSIPNPRS